MKGKEMDQIRDQARLTIKQPRRVTKRVSNARGFANTIGVDRAGTSRRNSVTKELSDAAIIQRVDDLIEHQMQFEDKTNEQIESLKTMVTAFSKAMWVVHERDFNKDYQSHKKLPDMDDDDLAREQPSDNNTIINIKRLNTD